MLRSRNVFGIILNMSEDIKFSVIMPTYGVGDYITDALGCISMQTYDNFEVIIVDDCSPEDLYTIVISFNDNRISYYRNEQNIGGQDLVALFPQH